MKKFPLLGKALALGAVTLGLLVALNAVSDIVSEREGRLREAEQAVADSLASQQTVLGPALQRHCDESWEEVQGIGADRRTVTQQRSFTLRQVPRVLQASGDVALEPRYRGLFKVNGFAAQTRLSAQWGALTALVPQAEHAGSRLRCGAPELFVAVSDVRGIRVATVRAADQALPVRPGSRYAGQAAGFHAVLPESVLTADAALHADVGLELLGTGSLAMAPIGENNQVQLRSGWPHPSFAGRFLPATREISDEGFDARWAVSSLATSAPLRLLEGASACGIGETPHAAVEGRAACVETFGVVFIDPVNAYVMSDRATKYGLLFIVLTFVGVGLVEVLRSLRVHPIQYLLVGSAIAMFFLLLVSLTEHLGFDPAYAIASAASTLLLAFYGSFVLRGALAGALFGAAIGALYGALYLLLRLEQSALVLGSVSLFGVLAVVMAATRRIDWYALMQQLRGADIASGHGGTLSARSEPSQPAPVAAGAAAPDATRPAVWRAPG